MHPVQINVRRACSAFWRAGNRAVFAAGIAGIACRYCVPVLASYPAGNVSKRLRAAQLGVMLNA